MRVFQLLVTEAWVRGCLQGAGKTQNQLHHQKQTHPNMEDSWKLRRWASVHNSQADISSLADSYTVRASLPSTVGLVRVSFPSHLVGRGAQGSFKFLFFRLATDYITS